MDAPTTPIVLLPGHSQRLKTDKTPTTNGLKTKTLSFSSYISPVHATIFLGLAKRLFAKANRDWGDVLFSPCRPRPRFPKKGVAKPCVFMTVSFCSAV
jgi:hypothetical protein